LVRAPRVDQVDVIFKRVCKIAEGAAMMTETEMTMTFDKACSNYIPNRSLEKILYHNLNEVGVEPPTEDEKKLAKEIWSTFTEEEQKNYLDPMDGFGYMGDGSEFSGKYVSDSISPYAASDKLLYGST